MKGEKREKNTIGSGHLVAEEESLEELQGSEIFEFDLGEIPKDHETYQFFYLIKLYFINKCR